MDSNYLQRLQAEYRKRILVNGFSLVNVNEEEREDGIGVCVGNNYVKGGCFYNFIDALHEVGEWDNYMTVVRAECKKGKAESRQHFATKDWSKHVAPIDEGA